jgi:hypothetical protein
MRVLKKGDEGPDVKAMQEGLNAKAPAGIKPVAVTGTFDADTEQSLIDFQKRNGLKPDGVFEERTRALLFPIVAYTVQVVGRKTDSAAGPCPALPLTLPPAVWTNFSLPTLPLAVPAHASPAPAGFHLDNIQLQMGQQDNYTPWFQLRPPSSNPQDSMFLTVQGVFLRSNDDRHLEITPGVTLQGPVGALSGLGPQQAGGWSLQYFVQFTAADAFWHFDRVHLASPFAQLSFQNNLGGPLNPTVGAGLYPINMSVDVLRTKSGDPLLSVIGQAGVVGSYNLDNKHFEIGASAALGLSVQFGGK